MTDLRRSLSHEERALLLTVRDDSDATELAEAVRRSDLTRLLHVSVAERATTLVWRRISALVAGRDAGEVQAFERTARVGDFRSMLLEDRLASTVAALGALPSPAVLLKGAALASSAYRAFRDRPMGDLDVLIDAADAAEAQRLLGGAGWIVDVDTDAERYEQHHHLPMISDAAGARLSIELHTALFVSGNPFPFGAAAVRADAAAVSVRGRPAMVPSPLHQLLHCALHFAWSHELHEGAWRTFRDVQVLVQQGVDWPAFVSLAKGSRGGTAAFWTLRLARRLAGVAVPPEVEAALAPPGGAAVIERLERHYAMNVFPQTARSPSQWMSHTLWEAGLRPGWSGHGRSRPWMWDERFMDGVATPAAPAPRWRQLPARLARWVVYARQVLGGPGTRTS